jgi:hypothetical protein
MQNKYIQNAALLTVKADGSYSYRSALKELNWAGTRFQSLVSRVFDQCDCQQANAVNGWKER